MARVIAYAGASEAHVVCDRFAVYVKLFGVCSNDVSRGPVTGRCMQGSRSGSLYFTI